MTDFEFQLDSERMRSQELMEERDRARATAVLLEQETAHLRALLTGVLAAGQALVRKWSLGVGRGDMVPADELRATLGVTE